VDAGGSASFSVTATGTAPLSYQWQFAGSPILNATGAVYSIPVVALGNQGEYRVSVSNPGASMTSAPATLTINGNVEARLSDLEILGNGHVRMNLSGWSGRNYYIEGSSTLTNWVFVGSILYTNGLVPFVDTTANGVTNRFYRARLDQ
jgi:hypothetical protein